MLQASFAQQLDDFNSGEAYWGHLDSMARQVFGADQLDSSLHYFSLMETWADRQPEPIWQRRVLQGRSNLLYRSDQFTAAIPDLRALTQVYAQRQDFKRQAVAHRRLAICLRKTGEFIEARDQYHSSIEAAQLAGKDGKTSLANAYNSLGNMYLNLEEYELAEDNYQIALPIYEAFEHQVGIASCLNNLSLIYSRNGRYEQAYPYLERSLELKIASEDHRGMANTYANLGDLAFEQQDYPEAKRYHLLSLEIRDSLNLLEDATQSYCRMGEIALMRQQPQEAIQWCSQSCAIAEAGHFWEARIACHRCLYQAYRQLQQWEASLAEHEIYTAIQDSINQANTIQELQFQEARQAFELALSAAKDEQEQLKQAAKRGQIIRWILIGLIIAAAMILLLNWRKRAASSTYHNSVENPQAAPLANELDAKEDQAARTTDVWLQQLQSSIEQMIEARQNITTGLLARTHHLSDRQLLRRIRDQTGLTTQQYVQDIKLQIAERWLKEQKFSKVKDLAEALGFKSTQYFSNLFSQRFGKPPSDYL